MSKILFNLHYINLYLFLQIVNWDSLKKIKYKYIFFIKCNLFVPFLCLMFQNWRPQLASLKCWQFIF